jgi:hypothetical protein
MPSRSGCVKRLGRHMWDTLCLQSAICRAYTREGALLSFGTRTSENTTSRQLGEKVKKRDGLSVEAQARCVANLVGLLLFGNEPKLL